MPMVPFMERFPEVGPRETRSVRIMQHPDLPNGEFGFIEFYCDEPGCDCRRVIVSVLRPETGWKKIWATISYGWAGDPMDRNGPFLDPLNPQSQYSHALLDLFRRVLESPEYLERLKRHYRLFRDSVEKRSRGRQVLGRRRRH